MVNPFLEQNRYLWHREEARALHFALYTAIREPQRIELLYLQSGDGLPPLALGHPPDIIWQEALTSLAARGLLVRFGRAIDELGMETLCVAVKAVLNAESTFSAMILDDDVLMLDRVGLRESIRLLEPDASQVKVLLVRGAPDSGKSHGRHLFERSAREWGAHAVYLGDGMVGSVYDVVLKLFSVLQSSDKIPENYSTEPAWYTTVAFRLQEVASRRGERMWIAIDDLGPADDGAPLLDPEILKFWEQFALNFRDPSFRQWFRLMLIHYPAAPVPTRWRNDIWREDRTDPADVKADDVAALIRQWSAARDRPLADNHLDLLVAEVMAKADDPPTPSQAALPRLERLNLALTEALQGLGSQP